MYAFILGDTRYDWPLYATRCFHTTSKTIMRFTSNLINSLLLICFQFRWISTTFWYLITSAVEFLRLNSNVGFVKYSCSFFNKPFVCFTSTFDGYMHYWPPLLGLCWILVIHWALIGRAIPWHWRATHTLHWLETWYVQYQGYHQKLLAFSLDPLNLTMKIEPVDVLIFPFVKAQTKILHSSITNILILELPLCKTVIIGQLI